MSTSLRHCQLHRALNRAKLTPFGRVIALSLGLSITGVTPFVRAANDAWSTSPSANNFSGMNWTTGSTTPGAATGTIASGDVLYFGTSSILALDDDEAANFNLGGFVFNAGASAFTITDLNAFQHNLTGNITNSGTNTETINDLLAFTAARTVTLTTGGGNVVLGGNLSGTGGALTMAGTGTLTLSGNNSFTGGVTVDSTGILQLQANSANTTAGVTSVLPTQNFTLAQLGGGSGGTIQLRADSTVASSNVVAFDSAATSFGVNTSGNRLSGTFNFDVNNLTTGTGQTLQFGSASTILYFGTGTTGTGATFNVTGGNGYSLQLGILSVGNNYPLTFNPTTANMIVGQITNGSTGTVTKNGAGSLTITGVSNYAGATVVNNGQLDITGSGSISASTTIAVGTTNAVGAAMYQSGTSTVTNTSGAGGAFQLGSAVGAAGYYNLAAGTLNVGGEIDPGGSGGGAGTFGQFDMSGGTLNLPNSASTYFLPDRGAAGEASVVNFSGGTVQINGSGTPANSAINGLAANWTGSGTADNAVITISGSGQFLTPSLTVKLNEGPNFTGVGGNAANVATLNLNGGTLQTLGFGAVANQTTATTNGNLNAVVNFNGGTLKAGTAANTTFLTGLGAVNVYSGGGTINNNGLAITVGQSLLAASGTGVGSIALGTAGTGYNAPPRVVFSGGTLTGGLASNAATGYATINPTTGAVTGIVITSPGSYTSTSGLAVALSGPTGGTSATLGTLTLNSGNTSGGMTFAGAGTTTLSAASTYTGATAINAGTVVLDHTAGTGALGETAVTVGANTLTVKGSTNIGVTSAATLSVGNGTAGTLNLQDTTINTLTVGGSLTLNSAALNFDLGTGTADAVNTGGTASVSGTNTINLDLLSGKAITSGNYTLITAAGGLGTGFTLGTKPAGFNNYSLANSTSTAEVLTIAANAAAATEYWTGLSSKNNGDTAPYKWGFGSTLATPASNWSTNLAGTTDALQVPESNTDTYFTATNASPTSANTLATQLDGGYSIKGLFFDTSLNANGITAVTIDTNANTLAIGTDGLTLLAADTSAVTISGTGSVLLNGSQTWANNSALGLTVSTGITGNATTGANTLTISDSGSGNIALGGVIGNGAGGGTLGLTVNRTGGGTVTLGGANTYTGPTTITAGTVKNGIANAVPAGSALTVSGGTYDLAGFGDQVAALSDGGTSAGTLTDSGAAATLVNFSTVSSTFSGLISGTLALAQTGASALTLSGANNTYSGNTTIGAAANTGSVVLATASGALGTGTIVFDATGNGSTALLQVSGGITLSNAIAFTGRNNASPGIESVSGNNTLRGAVALGTGGGSYYVQSDAGLLTMSGNITPPGSGTRTLTLQGAGNGLASGVIGFTTGNTLNVAMAGTGTWTLSGANTYTGTTTVSSGTLLVNGSTTSGSAVTVSGTGTLGGTGTVAGTVAVNSGGTISPGPGGAVGNLTTGALTLAVGSTLNTFIASDSSVSQLLATTTSAAGAFSVTLPAGATFAATGEALTVIPSGFTGTFTNSTFSTGGYTFTADYTTLSGGFDLDVTAVPEPTTVLGGLLLVAMAGYRERRRLSVGWQALRRAF